MSRGVEIVDEFTGRTDVSRQRRYQLRKHRDGRCDICGAPAVTSFHCEAHRRSNNLITRENMRRYQGCKRRNLSAESYHFNGGAHP